MNNIAKNFEKICFGLQEDQLFAVVMENEAYLRFPSPFKDLRKKFDEGRARTFFKSLNVIRLLYSSPKDNGFTMCDFLYPFHVSVYPG
jgi:hypothetical protein